MQNGTNRRHLFKVFGIRFDILVNGKVSVQGEGVAGGLHSCLWVSVVVDDRRVDRMGLLLMICGLG
jgi:hypothetical protein